MSTQQLAATIDAAFEDRANVGPSTKGAVREAVETALDMDRPFIPHQHT